MGIQGYSTNQTAKCFQHQIMGFSLYSQCSKGLPCRIHHVFEFLIIRCLILTVMFLDFEWLSTTVRNMVKILCLNFQHLPSNIIDLTFSSRDAYLINFIECNSSSSGDNNQLNEVWTVHRFSRSRGSKCSYNSSIHNCWDLAIQE